MDKRIALRDFSLLIALVLIALYFYTRDPRFLSSRNLTQLGIELSATAVLSLGMLLIILPGHIDLSVGSGVGLIGGVAAVLISNQDWAAAPALLVTTVLSLLIYTGMGWIIMKERVPAFIITLGGLLVFKGVHWLVIENETVAVAAGNQENLYSLLTTFYLPQALGVTLGVVCIGALGWAMLRGHRQRSSRGFSSDGELVFLRWFLASQVIGLFVLVMSQYKGLPLAALILGVVALLVHVLLQQTRLGRYLYAVGGNEQAALVAGVPVNKALVAGVPVNKVVIGAFALMGVIVALAGFLQTAFGGSSTTTTGQLMELDAIAACVIGGTSLKGGQGTVVGVLFGALIMAMLLNGMTLLAVSPEQKFIARGLVLALAVWMDVRLSRSRAT
jgi:D-xylose transport system permease protein